MLHNFCIGPVENMLQARRKQIPALKARNSKARGETPGLDGFGTSPARAAQLLCRPCRAKPTFCPRTQGSRARCRVLFHPGLCCAAPALGCAFCCGLPRKQKVCGIRRDAGAPACTAGNAHSGTESGSKLPHSQRIWCRIWKTMWH
jgi:hypothetical protein